MRNRIHLPAPLVLVLYLATVNSLARAGNSTTSVMFVPRHFSDVVYSQVLPAQIAADAQGNVYVPDSYANVVYRFSGGASAPQPAS